MSLVQELIKALDIHPHFIWSPDPVLYNCSGHTLEEWEATGTKKPLQGLITVVFGVFVIMLYVVTLIAMTDRNSLKHFCYQIMYFTSIFDITNLFCSNVVTGYYLVVGAVFCTHPQSIHFLGSIANGSWAGMSISVIVLALGRLAEITGTLKVLFRGRMSVFWMSFSLFVTLFFMFLTYPVLFNSTAGAWTFIPMIRSNRLEEVLIYRNILCLAVVILTPLCITLIYVVLMIYVIILKAKFSATIFTKAERSIFMQCFIISAFLSITCYLYICVFLLEVPSFIKIMAQAGYQTTECAPLIGYLIFNQGIRKRVFYKLRGGSSGAAVQDLTNNTS